MSTYTCPICGDFLWAVRNEAGWMNDDQFDAIKAGDFYCENKRGISHDEYGRRAKSGLPHFWQRELAPTETRESGKLASCSPRVTLPVIAVLCESERFRVLIDCATGTHAAARIEEYRAARYTITPLFAGAPL